MTLSLRINEPIKRIVHHYQILAIFNFTLLSLYFTCFTNSAERHIIGVG